MAERRPRVTPRLELEELRQLSELVRAFCGIKLSDDARDAVERRLGERVEELGLSSFTEYNRYLREGAAGKPELERACELIATNETYFFRELPQLRAFEREVLPQLHRLSLHKKSLTIWSAGCSTGEEVYTIAIIIARSSLFGDFTVRVFGSDISRRVLQIARKGLYRNSSFRAMPQEYEQHFVKTQEGRLVQPAIRAMCHFGQFNLLDGSRAAVVGRVDAIFCRNVLIYFDEAARRTAIANFYERLHPGGYLMLGHSESLLSSGTAFIPQQLSGDLVYQKPLLASLRPRSR